MSIQKDKTTKSKKKNLFYSNKKFTSSRLTLFAKLDRETYFEINLNSYAQLL